jgi:putative membrane protein
MKKTLVLVVDRDDDYGVKGEVDTPVVGIEPCASAATALGIADPEDSDVNTLFAAINIYRELSVEGKDVEIALICGDKKVGHKSDAAVIDELETVLGTVRPSRVILVSDGAEDEYVYPIISSRVPIDSVRKVFVKQSPGLEGAVYIVSKMLSDPDKRKRFLAPIGWIILLVGLLYLIPSILLMSEAMSRSDISSLSGSMVIILIGLLFLTYSYNAADVARGYVDMWKIRIRSGSVVVTFTILSASLVLVGLVLGIYSAIAMYTTSLVYTGLWLMSNALWPITFGVLVYIAGEFANDYINLKAVRRGSLIGGLNVVALALVIQGVIDLMISYFGFAQVDQMLLTLEIVLGIAFAFSAGALQRSLRNYVTEYAPPEDSD